MAQCGLCGAENPDDAFTCAKCGEALGSASRAAVPRAPQAPPAPQGPVVPMAAPVPVGVAEPEGEVHVDYNQLYPQSAPAPYPQAYPQYPTAYGMQPGPYGQPYQVVLNPPTSSKAVMSLVFGILGIFFCPIIFSLMAMIFGRQAKEEIARGMGTVGGSGLANAGYILGIVGLVIYGLFIALYAVLFMIAASSSIILALPLLA